MNAFKGLWKFHLAKDSQAIFSFLTEYGVYTPRKVIQGNTDSAHAVSLEFSWFMKRCALGLTILCSFGERLQTL